MAELTLTHSEVARLLAATFTYDQLRAGARVAVEWSKPEADALAPDAYTHWMGLLNDAALIKTRLRRLDN